MGIGLKGIQRGLEQAQASAERITQAFSPEGTEDAAAPMIELSQARRQVEASSKVVKVGDKMLGSILDIIG